MLDLHILLAPSSADDVAFSNRIRSRRRSNEPNSLCEAAPRFDRAPIGAEEGDEWLCERLRASMRGPYQEPTMDALCIFVALYLFCGFVVSMLNNELCY